MRCSGAGVFLPARMRCTASEMVAFQRQRVVNSGASSSACISTGSALRLLKKRGSFVEREAVGLAERQHDRILGGRCLQLEVERAAKTFAQHQSEGAVDARAKRRVNHQVHIAGFVEEALEHQPLLRGQQPEHGLGGGQVLHQLPRCLRRKAGSAPPICCDAGLDVLAHRPPVTRHRSARADADTASDSSALRAGASPSQNGIVGG